MIRLVQGVDRNSHPYEIDRMHRIRKLVFHDRLRWDVTVRDDWEMDRFDECNPLYLLSIDSETGDVRGSVRLLPTTGPNMLRDVFPELLPPGMEIASSLIWESSRFSIDPDYVPPARSAAHVSAVTAELLLGLAEVGQLVGLTHIVSVYDAAMARVFRQADCRAEPIGTPHRYGRVMTYAGLFRTDDAMVAALRASSGHTAPVLEKARHDPVAAIA